MVDCAPPCFATHPLTLRRVSHQGSVLERGSVRGKGVTARHPPPSLSVYLALSYRYLVSILLEESFFLGTVRQRRGENNPVLPTLKVGCIVLFKIIVREVSQCYHQGAVHRKSRYVLGVWVPEEGVRSGRGIKESRGSDRSASEVVSGADISRWRDGRRATFSLHGDPHAE